MYSRHLLAHSVAQLERSQLTQLTQLIINIAYRQRCLSSHCLSVVCRCIAYQWLINALLVSCLAAVYHHVAYQLLIFDVAYQLLIIKLRISSLSLRCLSVAYQLIYTALFVNCLSTRCSSTPYHHVMIMFHICLPVAYHHVAC